MTEYIYVDINSGSDETGDGSLQNPYKTLHHFMVNVAIKNGASYEISLSEGNYDFSAPTFLSFQNSKITIVGQGIKTALVQSTGIASNSGGTGFNTTTIEFCRLIYKTTFTTPTINCNCFRWNWIMRNVAFVDIPDDRGAGYATLGFMYPVGSKLEMYNCIKHKSTVGFLRTTNGTIKVYDSAGPFKSGYATNDANWNASGNLIKELNFSDKFEILGDEHLGLYAGEYSWSNHLSLIKHEGKYKRWLEESPAEPEVWSDDTINLVSKMTSNSSAGQLAFWTYKTDKPGAGIAFNVFDYAVGTETSGISRVGSSGIIGVIFSKEVTVARYEIEAHNIPTYAPRIFTIEGSNDTTTGLDGTWTTIDSRTGIYFAAKEKKSFELNMSSIFKALRLNIAATNHSNTGFAELRFFPPKILLEEAKPRVPAHWSEIVTLPTTAEELLGIGMESISTLLSRRSIESDLIPMNKKE